MEFRTFYSRDLDLDPMTFNDSVKMYPHTKINLLRQAFRKLSYYRQTDIETERQMPRKHYHAASWVVNIKDVVFVSFAKRLNETSRRLVNV